MSVGSGFLKNPGSPVAWWGANERAAGGLSRPRGRSVLGVGPPRACRHCRTMPAHVWRRVGGRRGLGGSSWVVRRQGPGWRLVAFGRATGAQGADDPEAEEWGLVAAPRAAGPRRTGRRLGWGRNPGCPGLLGASKVRDLSCPVRGGERAWRGEGRTGLGGWVSLGVHRGGAPGADLSTSAPGWVGGSVPSASEPRAEPEPWPFVGADPPSRKAPPCPLCTRTGRPTEARGSRCLLLSNLYPRRGWSRDKKGQWHAC